jgi:hypothetical protein
MFTRGLHENGQEYRVHLKEEFPYLGTLKTEMFKVELAVLLNKGFNFKHYWEQYGLKVNYHNFLFPKLLPKQLEVVTI